MILVTGGTGFVGRALVRQLASQGRQLRVLTRGSQPPALSAAVEWASGDLADPGSLERPLHQVDVLVHLAAAIEGEPARLHAINVRGTQTLAQAAREAGVRHFVHVSSAGVYGERNDATPHRESDPPAPGNPYERSKLAAEHALAAALSGSQVNWTILRPAGVYGSARPATAQYFRLVARRRCWFHGPARVLVHPTYVADLVRAIEGTLEHPELQQQVINIGGERSLDLRELIQLIGSRVGRRPLQLSLPGWSGAWGHRWVNRSLNIDKARTRLGFVPVSLSWGLDRTASELKSKGML